jgi:hypothetical protein
MQTGDARRSDPESSARGEANGSLFEILASLHLPREYFDQMSCESSPT